MHCSIIQSECKQMFAMKIQLADAKIMIDKSIDDMILFSGNKQRFPPLTSGLRLLGSVIRARFRRV